MQFAPDDRLRLTDHVDRARLAGVIAFELLALGLLLAIGAILLRLVAQ